MIKHKLINFPLQFYLRDLCGIPTDSAEYESGEAKYSALLELENGKLLQLGIGKIDPENNFGFVHFDRAEFLVRKMTLWSYYSHTHISKFIFLNLR